MVEWDALEMRYIRKDIGGSNPPISASQKVRGREKAVSRRTAGYGKRELCFTMRDMEARSVHLTRDIIIIFFSIVIAVLLLKSGILSELISSAQEIKFIGSIIAGLFFTSVFTVSIAAAVLGEIAAESQSVVQVALLGGLGAVIGDLVIFNFVKDSLTEDIEFLFDKIKNQGLISVFHHRLLRWLVPLIGALIIASPLPDELGISILGFAKLRTALFIPISFTFNFLGILIVGLIAKNLLAI